jgi:hypothetical protein
MKHALNLQPTLYSTAGETLRPGLYMLGEKTPGMFLIGERVGSSAGLEVLKMSKIYSCRDLTAGSYSR